jgi:hypothetical protein
MKNLILFASTMFMTLGYPCVGENSPKRLRATNYVPDVKTAKKIAEAIWLPIYGEKIYNEKPYKVSLRGDSVWVV